LVRRALGVPQRHAATVAGAAAAAAAAAAIRSCRFALLPLLRLAVPRLALAPTYPEPRLSTMPLLTLVLAFHSNILPRTPPHQEARSTHQM
jgi:hypothetical protein